MNETAQLFFILIALFVEEGTDPEGDALRAYVLACLIKETAIRLKWEEEMMALDAISNMGW